MNRWILRGLTVAGFAAGAWLLGSAAAYAHDASTGTTASGTVEVDLAVDLGTSTPPAVMNISNNVSAQAALTAKRLTWTVRSAPVAQARAALPGEPHHCGRYVADHRSGRVVVDRCRDRAVVVRRRAAPAHRVTVGFALAGRRWPVRAKPSRGPATRPADVRPHDPARLRAVE